VSKRSVDHATFEIQRTYEAPPARVFAAWAEPRAKAIWFGPSDAPREAHTLDFAVGGAEHLTVTLSGGDVYTYDACYQDIVPDERIIYSYEMRKNAERIGVSLSTVVLDADGEGTRLTYTEQGVFLDGLDTPAAREHGTRELLDALAGALRTAEAGV
jgi:uncharacterized protein YndB with AHSA1/START domain